MRHVPSTSIRLLLVSPTPCPKAISRSGDSLDPGRHLAGGTRRSLIGERGCGLGRPGHRGMPRERQCVIEDPDLAAEEVTCHLDIR